MIPLQTASPHPVTHLRFSPDGALLAVAQPHHGVTVLERATGRTVATCAMPRRGVLTGLIFCDGGMHIAAASAKGLEVFDARNGEPVLWKYGMSYKGMRLAERDGEAIGFGPSTAGPVWSSEKPTGLASAFDPLMHVYRPSFTPSPNGRFALEPTWRAIRLHDNRARRYIAVVYRPNADHDEPFLSAFCPLSRRFAVSDGRTLDVFDISPPEIQEEPESESESELAIAPPPHVHLDPTFSLAPDRTGEAPGWYPPFALCADGRGLLVKRPRNRIQLWDAPTATLLHEWSWRFEWVTCVAVSTDNTTAVAGGRHGRVLLWDLE